jgi:hypothetical protein
LLYLPENCLLRLCTCADLSCRKTDNTIKGQWVERGVCLSIALHDLTLSIGLFFLIASQHVRAPEQMLASLLTRVRAPVLHSATLSCRRSVPAAAAALVAAVSPSPHSSSAFISQHSFSTRNLSSSASSPPAAAAASRAIPGNMGMDHIGLTVLHAQVRMTLQLMCLLFCCYFALR